MLEELEYYENWLGKRIEDLKYLGELKLLNSGIKYNKSKDFFGMFHNEVSFLIDDKDTLKVISLIFPIVSFP